MTKILREVAQFQLIPDNNGETYFVRNSITDETSYSFCKGKMELLIIIGRYDFVNRCIQRAGNNLQFKIQ